MTVALAEGGFGGSDIDVTADPLRADEAVRWFEQRVPITRRQWDALDDQARRRAFMVSGVTALDVLDDVWSEIDRAVANGTSFDDFKRTVGERLASEWSGSNPSRLETVFRTNIQSAYQAGRYQQMTDPDVVATRPYWQFVAIMDSATTAICRPLDDVTRLATDGFWRTHFPPLHYNCRSTVITLTEGQGAGLIGEPMGAASAPLDGFGGTPNLSEWAPQAADYPAPLWHAFEAWQAAR